MAIDIKLPDVGDEDIEDVTINRWLVKEGDEVSEGDVLLEVATDKVDTEVEATASGTILKLNYGEGELVEIDAVLGQIGEAGEETNGASGSDSAEVERDEEAESQGEPQAEQQEESQSEQQEAERQEAQQAPQAEQQETEQASGDADSSSASGGSSGETIEVRLPQDDEIEDVTINRWLVSEGDKVSVGDVLLEVATDKVDTEIPSPADGTVLKLNFGEGELIDITEVVAIIGPEGASVSDSGSGGSQQSQTKSSGGAGDNQGGQRAIRQVGSAAEAIRARDGE